MDWELNFDFDETITTVGSQAYNLAGDPISRDNYLKTSIITAIVLDVPEKGKALVNSLIDGPGVKLRNFADWASTSGYNAEVGNNVGYSFGKPSLSAAAFEAIVPSSTDVEHRLIYEKLGGINLPILARQYVHDNHPEKIVDDYSVTYERALGVATGNLIVTFSDLTTATFTPTVNILDPVNKQYLYVEYQSRSLIPLTPPDVPAWTVLEVEGNLPSTTGYTGVYVDNIALLSINPYGEVSTFTEYLPISPDTTDYSAMFPDENAYSSTIYSENFNSKVGTFSKIVYIPSTENIGYKRKTYTLSIEYYYRIDTVVSETTTNTTVVKTYENPPGTFTNYTVNKRVITTTTTRTVVPLYRHRETYVEEQIDNWGSTKLAVYLLGSVPATDTLIGASQTVVGDYFPVIPIRRDNFFVDADTYPDQWEWNKKASRHAFGKNILTDLIENLETSPQLSDLDHAWIVFGVSLGTKQKEGKEYIYEFFKALSDGSAASGYEDASSYLTAWDAYVTAYGAYVDARNNLDENSVTPPPEVPYPPLAKAYEFGVDAESGASKKWAYNVSVSALGGYRSTGTGYSPHSGDIVGSTWLRIKGALVRTNPTVVGEFGSGNVDFGTPISVSTDIIAVGKQLTDNSWEEYEFWDVQHKNTVIDGYTVITTGGAAIATPNENSPFIIPLNEVILNNMSLVRRNQLCTEVSFLVINYYYETDIPWYSSELFQFIVILVIIYFSLGSASGASSGILGTNASVGAKLGLVGTAAILAGALVNAVTAYVVSILISKLAKELFGDTALAQAVAMIANMALLMYGSSGNTFDSAAIAHSLTRADVLLKLTMAGADAYSKHLSEETAKLVQQTQESNTEYASAMKEMSAFMNPSSSGSGIGTQQVMNALNYVPESEKQFFNRTLMTGDDIADITIKLVEKFPTQQLILP